jgi:hypothetical protein
MFNTKASFCSGFAQCPIPDEINCKCGEIGVLPTSYLHTGNLNNNCSLYSCPIRVLTPITEPLFKKQRKSKQ